MGIDDAVIRFAGVDMLDGPALIDLKPYVDRIDLPHGAARSGRLDTVTFDANITPASLRPPAEN